MRKPRRMGQMQGRKGADNHLTESSALPLLSCESAREQFPEAKGDAKKKKTEIAQNPCGLSALKQHSVAAEKKYILFSKIEWTQKDLRKSQRGGKCGKETFLGTERRKEG